MDFYNMELGINGVYNTYWCAHCICDDLYSEVTLKNIQIGNKIRRI